MRNQGSNEERWNVAFIEARQDDVMRKILGHCGLWHPLRDSSPAAPKAVGAQRESNSANIGEMDPDFLARLHREKQAELPGEQ